MTAVMGSGDIQVKPIPVGPDEVWPFPGALGNRRAMQVVGTAAAPLLAGFAFALLVLVLPTFAPTTTTLRAGNAVATTTSGAFSAHPVVAAALLVLAGMLLIFATQACFTMVLHDERPSDLQEWFPQYFLDRGSQDPNVPNFPSAPETADLLGPIQIGRRWYGGWARTHLYHEITRANRSARWLRALYNLGIMSLLWGVTFLVWPPGTGVSFGRVVTTVVAGVGAGIETVWSLIVLWREWGIVRRSRLPLATTADRGVPPNSLPGPR